MHVVYLTTDEVHRELAFGLAGACGVTLEALTPSEFPPEGPADALIFDVAFLPRSTDEKSWKRSRPACRAFPRACTGTAWTTGRRAPCASNAWWSVSD
jgi:hypothetical protein